MDAWVKLSSGLRRLARKGEGRVLPPDTSLLALEGWAPPGFVHGLELLNDRSTPLDFVAEILTLHAGVESRQAVRLAVEAHSRGGVLVPLDSAGAAAAAAGGITAEARVRGYALICRAVSAEP